MLEWPMWRMTMAFSRGTAIPLIDTVTPDGGGPDAGGGAELGGASDAGAAASRAGGGRSPTGGGPAASRDGGELAGAPPLPPVAAGGLTAGGTGRSISLTPQPAPARNTMRRPAGPRRLG